MNPIAEPLASELLDGLRDLHPAQAASAIVQVMAALALIYRRRGDPGDISLPDLIDVGQELWDGEDRAKEATSPFKERAEILRLSESDHAPLVRRLNDCLGTDGFADRSLILELSLALARRADTRGEFMCLNPWLSDILLAVLVPIQGETAYCAYPGAAEMALRLGLKGLEVRLELERGLAGFWSAVAVACDAPVTVTDTMSRQDPFGILPEYPALYDLALVVLPFGKRAVSPKTGMTSEMAGIELAVSVAKRSLVVVPASVLFRTSGADQAFKDQLIDRGKLRAVAALPTGAMLPHTNIASGLLLLGPRSQDERILMMDSSAGPSDVPLPALFSKMMSEDETHGSRRVLPPEIAAQGFNLSPERYVLSSDARRVQTLLDQGPTATLDDLVEILRPQMVVGKRGPASGIPEISVSDIGDFGLVESPGRHVEPDADQFGRLSKARVREDDILLVAKGSVGKAGLVGPDGNDWIASQSFVILRPRRHGPLADAAYLYRYLTSEIGQTAVQSLKVGMTVPMLQMADIKGFAVPLRSAEEQARIGAQVRDLFALQGRIAQMRREGAERQAGMWPMDDL